MLKILSNWYAIPGASFDVTGRSYTQVIHKLVHKNPIIGESKEFLFIHHIYQTLLTLLIIFTLLIHNILHVY